MVSQNLTYNLLVLGESINTSPNLVITYIGCHKKLLNHQGKNSRLIRRKEKVFKHDDDIKLIMFKLLSI
jgi:hypothetical protein